MYLHEIIWKLGMWLTGRAKLR
ncbi:hypothetical protein LCGC14_1103090, partial [marine sediment metagenome]